MYRASGVGIAAVGVASGDVADPPVGMGRATVVVATDDVAKDVVGGVVPALVSGPTWVTGMRLQLAMKAARQTAETFTKYLMSHARRAQHGRSMAES